MYGFDGKFSRSEWEAKFGANLGDNEKEQLRAHLLSVAFDVEEKIYLNWDDGAVTVNISKKNFSRRFPLPNRIDFVMWSLKKHFEKRGFEVSVIRDHNGSLFQIQVFWGIYIDITDDTMDHGESAKENSSQ